MTSPSEALFEDAITAHLASVGGYLPVKWGNRQGAPRDFDAVRGLDTAELFSFVGATQPDAWSALVKAHGGDPDRAQRLFADRLAKLL